MKNWIWTIKGFQYLWNKLKDNFKFLCLRNFIQDPLENLFGSLRSHGIRKINPTPEQFVNTLKSLTINNLLSQHSPGSNCEVDDNELLNNLRNFLQFDTAQKQGIIETEQIETPETAEDDAPLITDTLYSTNLH